MPARFPPAHLANEWGRGFLVSGAGFPEDLGFGSSAFSEEGSEDPAGVDPTECANSDGKGTAADVQTEAEVSGKGKPEEEGGAAVENTVEARGLEIKLRPQQKAKASGTDNVGTGTDNKGTDNTGTKRKLEPERAGGEGLVEQSCPAEGVWV